MRHIRSVFLGALAGVLIAGSTGCYYDVEEELYPLSGGGGACDTAGFGALTYTNGIKPVFDTYCATAGCHVSGGAPGNFTSYSGIQPKVNDGSIEQRSIVDRDMPPAGMPSCDRAKLKAWLDAGAPQN